MYNNKFLLNRIIEIQDIVLEHKNRGYTQVWVYRRVIKPRYHISESTFKGYMSRNAKGELKQLTIDNL